MSAIPIDARERLLDNIVPITTVGPLSSFPSFPINSIEGTGFILGDGYLVTCWHCVATAPADGCFYSVNRMGPEGRLLGSPLAGVRQVSPELDLALGRVRYANTLGFKLAESAPPLGADVWTFGYPLPGVKRLATGLKFFTAHPRLLKGYITRPFVYEHPSGARIPSWELSFSAPEGLSGAPVFLTGTLDIVGVVYGNNDVEAVEYRGFLDPASGEKESAVHRIVSFGLAHHWSSLAGLRDLMSEPAAPDAPVA
jgi:hypothetical protein